MLNWDDLRVYLALARTGSALSAAARLGVHHTTVARRLSALEESLGARLFERLRSGYALTQMGERILSACESMEEEILGLEREVKGSDIQLSGTVRITAPASVLVPFIIPHLPRLAIAYPGIHVEVIASDDPLDLNKSEADLALRVTPAPPESLLGRHLAKVALAIYAKRELLERPLESMLSELPALTWLSQSAMGNRPPWLKRRFPNISVPASFDNPDVLTAAVKAGAGMAQLACFVGDPEPGLARVPGMQPDTGWDLWLLWHRDLRKTARVRVLVDYLAEVIGHQRDLIEGRRPGPGLNALTSGGA